MQEESLEQALKLQIQKRIEVESKASHLQSHIHDLQELLEALVLEVSTVVEQEEVKNDTRGSSTNISSTVDLNDIDGVDNDDDPRQQQDDDMCCPSAMMERKDVLWMLKEIQIRIQNITSLTPSLTVNGNSNPCTNQNDNDKPEDNNDDDVLPLKLHYETQLAKLQGQLTQMQEMLQDRTSCKANRELPQARVGAALPTCTAAASATSTTTTIQEQINKYQRLEKRHGIMMEDMQQELQEKQKRIQSLEKELEFADLNNKNNPSSPPMAMMFQSPHKDLLIASLQEDLEERDLVIAELKAELEQQGGLVDDRDGVGIGLGNVAIGNEMMYPTTKDNGGTNRMDSPWKRAGGSSRHHHHTAQEADKVKIKYMEGIIHSLEKKVEYLEQRCNANHGQSPPSMEKQEKQYQSPLNSKSLNTMDHLHDWRMDAHTLVAPGGYSSLQVEDMELEIAELVARLKDCQEEKMLLEQELSQWKEGNGVMMKRGESHAGPQ